MTRRMDDETRGFASRERASRAVERTNERRAESLDLDVRSRDLLDRRVRSRRRRGYTMASVAHRLSASAAVVSSSRANGARGGTTRGVKGTRAKGARGTAGMTRAMAREECARATRLSTRSRSVDDAARGPSVRRLGGRFAKTTVTGGRRRAVARAADGGVVPSNFKKFTEIFANLFPIWTILAAVAGVMRPNTFSFMTSGAYTGCLALLMFSMGITLTIDDFKRVFAKPRVIGLGFFACYVLMPALAFIIGNALGLSGPLLAGLILVGSINGGQASNLCAYIAKGDVALSVLMTTATTVGCIFMTPLICKLALGAVVDETKKTSEITRARPNSCSRAASSLTRIAAWCFSNALSLQKQCNDARGLVPLKRVFPQSCPTRSKASKHRDSKTIAVKVPNDRLRGV